MAQPLVTKIYELRSIGYDQLISELSQVNTSFEAIRKTKIALNQEKLNTTDKASLTELNEKLKDAKTKTVELRLERQKLVNEAKAAENVQLAKIAAQKAENAETEKFIGLNKAEAGSLTEIITQRKLLGSLIQGSTIDSLRPIDFQGQSLSYQEAIAQFKALQLAEKEYLQSSEISSKAQISQANAIAAANKIEAGSYADVIIRRKELQNLLAPVNPDSGTLINFRGTALTYDEATAALQRLIQTEKAYVAQSKPVVAANDAEYASLSNIISRRKELQSLMSKINPDSGTPVQFEGNALSYEQAADQLRNLIATEQAYSKQIRVTIGNQDAEYMSLADLVAKRKELTAAMSLVNPESGTSVDFRGSTLSYQQAIDYLKSLLQAEKDYAAQTKLTTEAVRGETGSYAALVAEMKELYAVLKVMPKDGTAQYKGQPISYQQAIDEYRRLSLAEQDFRRQFKADSVLIGEYTSGIVNAFKSLGLSDLTEGQITKTRKDIEALNVTFEELKAKLRSLKATGDVDGLAQVEKDLIANRNEANNLTASLARVEAEMRSMGDVGNQVSTSIATGFQKIKSQISQLVIGYIGFQALFTGATKLISENKELSDEFADLQIRIHGTSAEVETLFNSLKKLDTRTSLTDLVDIANVVAKKGVAKEEIGDVTKALNDLFVVLGKEMGDPAAATSSIVKMITIFHDDKHVTAERINEIGTAMFKLTTSGVATGSFLVRFAERVGSIRGITGLTIPAVLGMGAALEQLGQREELAGTAAIQLASNMFNDIPKFAKAAGQSVEDFRALLAKDPFEALVDVAENLRKSGETMEGINYEEVVKGFSDIGITGVRIKAVLADIATNGQFVMEKMKAATASTQDYANMAAASTLKQETFAATLQKIAKQFEILGTNKTVRDVLLGISTVILLILNNLGLYIPLFTAAIFLSNTAWGATLRLTTALLLENAARVIEIGQLIAHNIVRATTNTLLAIYTSLTFRAALATGASATAMRILAAAIAFMASPLGIAIGLLAGLLTLLGVFSSKAQDASKALTALGEKQRFINEATATANRQIGETIAKENILLEIIKDRTLADKTRESALGSLKEMMGEYGAALTLETVLTKEGTEAVKAYNAQLLEKAKNTAIAAIADRESSKLATLVQYQRDIKTAMVEKGSVSTADFDNDIIDKFYDKAGKSGISKFGKFLGEKVGVEFEYSGKDLKIFAQVVKEEIEKQVDKTKGAEIAKAESEAKSKITASVNNIPTLKVKPVEIDIEDLRKQIAQYDKTINEFRGSQKELDKLLAARKALNDKLNEALDKGPKDKPYRGARLPGETKDQLSEIQAQLDAELAIENTRYNDLQRSHVLTYEEERDHVKKIEELNLKYLDQKIATFGKESTLNARELQTLAKFKEDRSKILLDSFNQLKSIDDKEYQEQRTRLKNQLDLQTKELQDNVADVNRDPNSTAGQRAQAKLNADQKILQLQIKFAEDMDALEKKFGQRTVANAKSLQDMLHKTTQEIIDDQLALSLSGLTDIKDAGERVLAEFKQQMAALKLANENSNQPTQKKAVTATNLDYQENVGILAREVAMAQSQLPVYKKLLADKKITDEEYNKFLEKLYDKQRQLREAIDKGMDLSADKAKTLADKIRNALTDLFKLKGTEDQKALAEVLQMTWDLADQAMNNYFDAEKQRIDASNKAAKTRIDLQEQLSLKQAQSEDERTAIQNQARIAREAEDKKAFEREKKIKLQQLTMNYALQLSNIAVAASANPLNPFTFGAAGIAQYIIQAAIATAAYLLNRGAINSATFEYGGSPDMNTTRGGKVKGRSHSTGGNPFMFKGRVFEDEVDELNIIRTKNVNPTQVHTIKGTHTEIASMLNKLGGGVEFRPGAKLLKFATGGTLGSTLQAPVFTPTTINNSNSSSTTVDLSEYLEEIKNLAVEQSRRIDRIEVLQVTSTVTKAQAKEVKQAKIGTL